jgi:hypothetical protein
MLKKLSKHGNGRALTLDKALLDLLNITDDTLLKITTDGKGLQIYPADQEHEKQYQTAKANSLKTQGKTIQALVKR